MAYSVKLSNPQERDKRLNLWSNPGFMHAVARLQGLSPGHLCCYKGQELVALLPVYEKRFLGTNSLCSPSGSYYQGLNLWLDEKVLPARRLLDTVQIFRAMAEYMMSRYRKLRINLSPETYDIRGFIFIGLKAKPLYTFTGVPGQELYPLPDERRKIKLAMNQDYETNSVFCPDEFINLFRSLNNRKNREFNFGYAHFGEYLQTLHALGLLGQFNLLKDGKIVSSNILLQDENRAYTVFRATEPEALKNGASGLHTILLLQNLQKRGIAELDFCGANVMEVARFKAALGLNLKAFYQIYG